MIAWWEGWGVGHCYALSQAGLSVLSVFLKQDCQFWFFKSADQARTLSRKEDVPQQVISWEVEKKETPPHCVVCTHTNSTSPNFLCPGAKIWPGRISEVSNLRFLQLTPNISPSGALHRGGKGEVKPKTTIYPNWICLAGWLASLDSLNWQPNWKPHSFYHLGTLCQLQAGQARGVREWSQYIK